MLHPDDGWKRWVGYCKQGFDELGFKSVDEFIDAIRGRERGVSMPGATVQLSAKGQHLVTDLVRECRKPAAEVIDAALESYRRERFVRRANTDLVRLRRNKKAWAAYQRELLEWGATLNDGARRNRLTGGFAPCTRPW
jgi:hypothetical protein